MLRIPSRIPFLAIALGATVVLAVGASALNAGGGNRGRQRQSQTLLAFDSMVGVDAPFLGGSNPIRGIAGNASPRKIRRASGSLDSRGNLRVEAKGLVGEDGQSDEEEIRAVVSCLTVAGNTVSEVNVATDGFRASRSGNTTIRERLDLPDPCLAPVVLLVSGFEDRWLAVNGIATDDDQDDNDN